MQEGVNMFRAAVTGALVFMSAVIPQIDIAVSIA
jgi:hypothetical protein